MFEGDGKTKQHLDKLRGRITWRPEWVGLRLLL